MTTAKPWPKTDRKLLLVWVNKPKSDETLYESTRRAWRLNIKKAAQTDLVLAVRSGEVVGAFVADEWLPVTPEVFPGQKANSKRLGFHGRQASQADVERFVGAVVPRHLQSVGSPRYSW